jgi:N-acetylgalactosamine kinase
MYNSLNGTNDILRMVKEFKDDLFLFFYSDFTFPINNVDINKDCPRWQDYFQCGFLGMVEHLQMQSAAHGMKCMVDGSVPPSSGLSSSSALVCCAALVTMHANGQNRPKVRYVCHMT